MATTFKTFLNDDITSTRTLLHEAIPITGSIVSGTYPAAGDAGSNIKQYGHGMFESVYDYPFLSSSANHIFDLTTGIATGSGLTVSSMASKKANIYGQQAQVLVGYDVSGSILEFDEDGDILAGGTKLREVVFVNLARLLTKDEIKKGSFNLQLGVGATFAAPFASTVSITDTSGSAGYRVNSPAGEYGILYANDSTGTPLASSPSPCGLLYYQGGIAVLTASIFGSLLTAPVEMLTTTEGIGDILTGSTINVNADAFRHRVDNLAFNNTTELNSSIYFCRLNNNDYNYSSNPTYLSQSKITVKNTSLDAPVTYPTTVGLYSADNELLAVAKLSEPLKKDPSNEVVLRVRLDY